MGYYCNICKKPITEKVYYYSKNNFGKALCMEHQKKFTQKTETLFICRVCKKEISEQVYDYSKNHFGMALCREHQTVTPQAIKLSKALKDLDVKHTLEHDDGHKHVDIAIEWAKLYIEIDGKQHGFNPKQMYADHERDIHSQQDGFFTLRIPNAWVDENAKKLALNIQGLANKRYKGILENQQKISISGLIKSVFTRLAQELEDY
jgi:very-short-patch-repair endonuclease